MPAVSSAVLAQEQAEASRDMTRIAFALAAYRAVEGEYPDKLDALLTDYMAQLPRDPFGQVGYRYKRSNRGFEVYSVGRNRTDDGGVSRWDDSDSDADDIVLRVPAKKQ